MEETHTLTARLFGAGRDGWMTNRRLRVAMPCVSVDAARAHVSVSRPKGMVVCVEHGPRGGWNRAAYFTYEEVRGIRWNPRFSWYIVLKELPKTPSKSKGLDLAPHLVPY
jgi:hypothetical protein